MKILVTGGAGFIGYHLSKALLEHDNYVTVIDNMNDYYNVSLKVTRLSDLQQYNNFKFIKLDISDKDTLFNLFSKNEFDICVNLAAQAGVRYSIENPDIYIKSNLIGFYNILEACRKYPVKHLVFASSSSVYGNSNNVPYSIEDKVDCPISLYAATKKSDELLAHAYSKLYNIPTTGLRFFTVYGPLGRPDMAYYSFTNKLVKGESINIFNYRKCERDFTYIDDVVKVTLDVINKPPVKQVGKDNLPIAPYKLYNIGKNSPDNLLDFINILSDELIKAKVLPKTFDINKHINLVQMQPGDVEITCADVKELKKDFNFKPKTSLREGLKKFSN